MHTLLSATKQLLKLKNFLRKKFIDLRNCLLAEIKVRVCLA